MKNNNSKDPDEAGRKELVLEIRMEIEKGPIFYTTDQGELFAKEGKYYAQFLGMVVIKSENALFKCNISYAFEVSLKKQLLGVSREIKGEPINLRAGNMDLYEELPGQGIPVPLSDDQKVMLAHLIETKVRIIPKY